MPFQNDLKNQPELESLSMQLNSESTVLSLGQVSNKDFEGSLKNTSKEATLVLDTLTLETISKTLL